MTPLKPCQWAPLFLAAGLAAACGGGGDPAPSLDTAARVAATRQTATSNAQCQAISPFYFEIGDKTGAIAGASIGAST